MNSLLAFRERRRAKLMAILGVALVVSLALVGIAQAGPAPCGPLFALDGPAGVAKCCAVAAAGFDSPGIIVVAPGCDDTFDDGACDYGRNPEKLWEDNPDGHPFERAFCDGNTEVQYKHPLDTPENEGLYCDEVPGCWAYGLN